MPPPQPGLVSLSLPLSSCVFLVGTCHHVTSMQLVASCEIVSATRTMSCSLVHLQLPDT